MIHLNFRTVKPEARETVELWLSELNGLRRDEALESLRAEGVRHETAVILDTSDGPILVHAMESDDIDRARRIGAASTLPVDKRHHEVMRAADGGPAASRVLLDLHDLHDVHRVAGD
ncbi:hypothetical protein B7R22_06700 [Subtercola boreus]|uniref:Uncharacterized protein n=1 Tax=Subtercola boreus TaxID=120213 RepID=A0A3E0VZP3_9MICO|nr:DUF6176 family protein [Subtercola boreus]RFA15512.1 hypothetical protein B7R22_06700 [Subtercola boreus]